jgi:hypothetical protein
VPPENSIPLKSASSQRGLETQYMLQLIQDLTNTNGNARGDVMRMLQATSVFEPNCIDIPIGNSGEINDSDGFSRQHQKSYVDSKT